MSNNSAIITQHSKCSSAISVRDISEEEGKRMEDTSQKKDGAIDEPIEWIEEESGDEDARVELGLIGRIWTDRHINNNAFVSTMKNVWQARYDVDVRNMGKNLYVFQFHHWKDKQRVLDGQPWHFDKHVILLGELEGMSKPSDIQLFKFPIWTRVYNLPFKGRLNEANVKAIGNKIGTFIKMDQSGDLGIDKSVRLRVWHDVRDPLTTQIKVKMKNGAEEVFDVKYERPPLYCFFCGKVGHGTKDCDEENDAETQEIKFGGWLKASPWKVAGGEESRSGPTCAKALFITKPKGEKAKENKEKVNEMVERMNKWGLEEGEGGNASRKVDEKMKEGVINVLEGNEERVMQGQLTGGMLKEKGEVEVGVQGDKETTEVKTKKMEESGQ